MGTRIKRLAMAYEYIYELVYTLDIRRTTMKPNAPCSPPCCSRRWLRYTPRGGYICSLSDHFIETPPEHLEAFARAARECVY